MEQESQSQSLSPLEQIAKLFPEDEDMALVILKMLLGRFHEMDITPKNAS